MVHEGTQTGGSWGPTPVPDSGIARNLREPVTFSGLSDLPDAANTPSMETGADPYQHEDAYGDISEEEILVQGIEGGAPPPPLRPPGSRGIQCSHPRR